MRFFCTAESRLDVAIAIGTPRLDKPSTSSKAPGQATTFEHNSFNLVSHAFQNVFLLYECM